MLISIIIPIYNVEDFLSKCVESILTQDYSNIELILVDDGSKDNSGEICDSYALTDSRVKVAHKKNGGQSSARNLGITMATGEYIAFVDADDFWLDNKLGDLVSNLEKQELDMLMFKTYSYYESTDSFIPFSTDYNVELFKGRNHQILTKILETDYSFGWCPIWYLIRREVLVKNNIMFPEGFLSEDVNYVFRLWNEVKRIGYYNDYVYVYRRENENSTTHIASFEFCEDLLSVIKMNLELIKQYSIEGKLKVLLLLNFQTLVEVVLFYFRKYDRCKQEILKKKIQELNEIYSIEKQYRYLYRTKEKIVSIFLKCFGVRFVASLWSLKSKLIR